MQHLTSTERIEALNAIATLAWQMGGGLTECHPNVGAIADWVNKIIASLLRDAAGRADLLARMRSAGFEIEDDLGVWEVVRRAEVRKWADELEAGVAGPCADELRALCVRALSALETEYGECDSSGTDDCCLRCDLKRAVGADTREAGGLLQRAEAVRE